MCIFLIMLFMQAPGAEVVSDEWTLLKREEIYLYRNRIDFGETNPYISDFFYYPYFQRTPHGEIFLLESYAGHFFSPTGDISRVIKINPEKSVKPGELYGFAYCTFSNSLNQFGAYDGRLRLHLWDSQGNLVGSSIVPQTIIPYVEAALWDKNQIVLAGLGSPHDGVLPATMVVTDTMFHAPKVIVLNDNSYGDARSKGVSYYFKIMITKLGNGYLASNATTDHEIYLITDKGDVLSCSVVPPHFQRLVDADSFKMDSSFVTPNEKHKYEMNWLSTWSYSNPIQDYSDNRFVVSRVLYPEVCLDVYSYSRDTIKYEGFVQTDKPLLFADTTGIYLLEENTDTCVVVGRYDLMNQNEREKWASSQVVKRVDIADLSNIKKVKPRNCEGCSRKNKAPRQYLTDLESAKLVSVNGDEYLLADSLSSEKNHVIVFASPQDCGLDGIVAEGRKYVRDTLKYDLSVVLTHEYAQELGKFAEAERNLWGVPVFTNMDRLKLKPLLEAVPGILMISNQGIIISTAFAPDFKPKPR